MKNKCDVGLCRSAAGPKIACVAPRGVWTHRGIKACAVALVAAAALAGCSRAPAKPETDQPSLPLAVPATQSAAVETLQVVAYYFHGTVRCETCLRVEKQAEGVMARCFGVELAMRELAFKTVDYDKPENAHFLTDYKLSSPSLVLVRQKAGKDQEWKLLERTWDLAKDPLLLDQYIEEETRKLLEGTAPGTPAS